MATMGTEESDQCRQVTVVERLKQEWMHGLSAKKTVAVVERWPLVEVRITVSWISYSCLHLSLYAHMFLGAWQKSSHSWDTSHLTLKCNFFPTRTKGLITANFVINNFWISLSFSALIQIICLFVIMSHLICPFLGGASSTSVATLQDRNTSPLFSQRRRFTKSLNKIRSTHLLKRVQAMLDMGLPAVRGRQLLRPVYG